MKSKSYLVSWDIDIDADSPEEAAQMAREIQLDPESFATIFMVKDKSTGKAITVDTLDRTCEPAEDEA